MARRKHKKRRGASGTSWLGTKKGKVHVGAYWVKSHTRRKRGRNK